MNVRWLGIEVGLLLAFLSKTFTHLHGTDVDLLHLSMLPLFSHAVYGSDRLEDARLDPETDLAKRIAPLRDEIRTSVNASILGVAFYLVLYDEMAFVPAFLFTVFGYREFKHAFPCAKPFLVALSSAIVAYVIPLHMSGERVFDDWRPYEALFLNMFAASNRLDIVDADDDRRDNVRTIPVVLGMKKAEALSLLTSIMATLVHVGHPHFGSSWDVAFEASNVLSIVRPTDFRGPPRDPPGPLGEDLWTRKSATRRGRRDDFFDMSFVPNKMKPPQFAPAQWVSKFTPRLTMSLRM